MPDTPHPPTDRAAAERAADVRARKARLRPAVTWGEIAARTKGPDESPYSEGYVRLVVNGRTLYAAAVLDALDAALSEIEAERSVAEREDEAKRAA